MTKVDPEDLDEDALLALAQKQTAEIKRLRHALADLRDKARDAVEHAEYLIGWAGADWDE